MELESSRNQLIEKSIDTIPASLRLIQYHEFFEKVLSLDNQNYNEIFLSEFIEDYITSAARFEPVGIHPKLIENILLQLVSVSQIGLFISYKSELITQIDRIKKEKEVLKLVLDGKLIDEKSEKKAYFPLVINDRPDGFCGILESVSLHFRKSSDADKFIIIPSETEIEKKIYEQCKYSWKTAINLSKTYVKTRYKFHEVIISFDKKAGFYEGNSLGVALTLSFLEQLLQFYNPTYLIKIKELTVFSGGLDETGFILSCGEEIIRQKINTVFFSEMNSFVIPKKDENAARNQLLELEKEFPNRKLKLIPIEDINDVLNRRDVVEIKKQKLVIRTGKFVKKNWVSAVVSLIFLLIFFSYNLIKFDTNPVSFKRIGDNELITNKFGQTLFEIIFRDNQIAGERYHEAVSFGDTDDDGINEVFWGDNVNEEGKIYAANYKQDTLWSLSLNRSIVFPKNAIDEVYRFKALKLLNFTGSNQTSVFVLACSPQFASYFIEIDTKTKQEKNLLINAGHILDIEVLEDENVSFKQILISGISNDWGGAFFTVLKYPNLSGQITVKQEKYKSQVSENPEILKLIVFPLSKVGENIITDHSWTQIKNVMVYKKSKTIRLGVYDGMFKENELVFFVNLDWKFNILDFTTSDNYDKAVNDLHSKGLIDFNDGKKYLSGEYYKEIATIK